ncbi:hypothetical protein [uncultured Hymenobacter sp.]|uniref:hypothetical protein n=1 Tax=uncultured Hymenobacter sp. TaxID=170016 RepID=UPI0035CAFEA0
MRLRFFSALPALLLLPQALAAQTAPTPLDSAAPRRWLLKAGLSPGRLLPQTGSNGFQARISPSIGLEYQLSPRFTLSGQAEADFTFPRRSYYLPYYQRVRQSLVPAAEAGLMLRYYYNQAGRARHNRAHGPFVGNYLALGTSTEAREYFFEDYYSTGSAATDIKRRYSLTPNAILYWGLQRRLGQRFLYDFNAGIGLQANYYPGLPTPYTFRYGPDGIFDLNLRLYFVR